jgi:TonB-linked SusC/RagA family outer membrane protein
MRIFFYASCLCILSATAGWAQDRQPGDTTNTQPPVTDTTKISEEDKAFMAQTDSLIQVDSTKTRIAVDSTRTDSTRTDSTRVAAQDTSTVSTGAFRVSGTVSSPEDGVVPGASIMVKGTTRGVVTDAAGKYTLMVETGQETLVVSFVGLADKEVPIKGQKNIDISLEPEQKVLKEVVVVGYGTMDRATLTSSVSTVGGEQIENDILPSVSQAIQGKAGGVQVTQKSGSPGGGVSIRVRGTTSINAGSDPLYVVDGIPVNSTTNFVGGQNFDFGGGTQGINILSAINPSDIESVEILKDAASSSIYGARAANGVVLITTKRGKPGSNQITVNAYAGVSQMPKERKYDLMNTAQYTDYIRDYYSYTNPATAPPATAIATGVDTDWQDEIFRTAPMQNYEINASGGSESTQYFTSLGYYKQEGILLNSSFERISGRMNVDHQFSKRLKLTTNINLTRALNDRVQEENSREGSTKNGFVSPPNLAVHNADGTWAYDQIVASRENPVAMLLLPVNKAETFRILANTALEYQIIPGLSIKTNWGADMTYIDEQFYMPPTGIRAFLNAKGAAGSRSTRDQLWVNENTLMFDKRIAELHHINLLGGIAFQGSKLSYVDARSSNFNRADIPYVSAGGAISGAAAGAQEWAIASYFARANYGYKDRYLVTANFRVDGSSRFGADNRYGFFPSVAAAWRISQESFLAGNKQLSNLKLRASWGITGNQDIGNYASYSLYSPGQNYNGQPGYLPTSLGDPDLGWETTKQTDIGVDAGFLDDRITLLADYYIKNTSDLLIGKLVPRTSGYTTALQNIGEIQNRGFEFELTSRNLVGDFRWTTSLNMTFNRNKVVSLPTGDLLGGLGNSLNIAREGYPLGSFFGWEMVGVNTETGMIDFARNDGSVGSPSNPADRRIIGDPNPDFFGGITNTFFYKNFDLNIMGQFSYGNDIFNYNLFTVLAGNSTANGLVDWTHRWKKPGDVTDVPRPSPGNLDNGTISTRFIEDGSFFRLRNITLGYTLPTHVTDRMHIKSLRVYATVQNAFVFTDYSGYDPEVGSSHGGAGTGLIYGYDYGSYPQPRIFTGGVTLTF